MRGRDGRNYPATKPKAAKPQKNTHQDAHNDQSVPWAEVVTSLNTVAEQIGRTSDIPEEMKPWQLVESLERTGRSLLQRARELRRRHKLT